MSRKKAFAMGTLSGIVEPIGALATIAAYRYLEPVLPVLRRFSRGDDLRGCGVDSGSQRR